MFRPTASQTVSGTAYSDIAGILESFPAYIAYLDTDLVYRFANSPYEQLFGRPRAEIIGKHVSAVLGESVYAIAGPRLRHALGGELYSYDAEFRFPGRPACWLAVHYIPDHHPDGSACGLFVFAVDISRRRRAEVDLQQAEAKFRTLYENAPVGISYYDPHGRLLQINRHGAADWCASSGDLIGRTLDELMGPEAAAPFVARLRAVAGSGQVEEHIDDFDLAAGPKCFLSSYAPMPGAGGSTTGVQIVSRDITALKRAEQENRENEMRLRQSQKMQAVGVMAGGVAHDFNNILQTVLSFTMEMLDDAGLSAAHREDLEVVREACGRGASLTSQLLAFSRQQFLSPKVLDGNDVVRSVFKMIQRLIGEDITLTLEPAAARSFVCADEGQFSQILLNLAVNARDAMPDGGRLTVATGNQVIGEDAPGPGDLLAGEYFVMSVTDTGCGMAPELIERIFEPFYTTKEVGRGTGLGLATVFGIVQQHGGHVEVASRPGQGSTFRVLLPLYRESVAAGDGDGAREIPGGDETILLAEDDPIVRRALERSLRRVGYHVLAASDGVQALAIHESHPGGIDLAVLDLVMPGCGGAQAFEVMSRRDPGLKGLFLSGYPSSDAGGPALAAVTGLLLRKPFSPEELQRAVRNVLDAVTTPA